jgi:hypothetical protein
MINFLQMFKLQVITDGIHIEINAPLHVEGRTCGLCGDFNGETNADLKSPGINFTNVFEHLS